VPEPGPEAWPKTLEGVRKERFVAYVSTIEARKNHLYVVEAWRALMAEGVDVPDLLFVGRLGWHIEPLMAVLRDTGNLGGRVHFAHGLSDADVASVYRHAMFTVFTSFVEGWGLPVGESLTYGTPCVASSSSSIPEVAGDFVDYLDPENLADGAVVLKRMIEDDAYRKGRKSEIARSFVPRLWSDVAADFIGKARYFSEADLPRRPLRIRLSEGRPLRLADLVPGRIDLEAYLANPVRLLFSAHFADPDSSGAWMQGAESLIKFATPCSAGSAVTLHLSVRAWPGFEGRTVSIGTGGAAPDARTIDVAARVGEEGMVVVAIAVDGSVPPRGRHDRRAFCLELVSIRYDPIVGSLT
jgi:glycosyltransferase involved in cell wall biosynthesis